MSASEPRALSFRAKLVIALLGMVVPVLVAALLVIRRETDTQIGSFLRNALRNSQAQLERVEKLRHRELLDLGGRFAASNRLPQALQQAFEGDTAFLAAQIDYELRLAGARDALVAFVDLDGNGVLAIAGGQRVANADEALAMAPLEKLVAGDTAAFAYHLVSQRLYSVHPVLLNVVDQPVGFMQLGFPIDQAVAEEIGGAIGADVCFVVGGLCVASTRSAMSTELATAFLTTARSRTQQRVELDGQRYALLASPIPGIDGAIVIALQLEQVLQPFESIQRKLVLVGSAALLLALGLALALGRSLAHPVRALVQATERVARGDYETRVAVKSRDELGALARSFNEMTYGLLLRDRYKGVLDKVVSRDIADELVKGEIGLGGETREVSVLFADIRGFTPMTEGMEPQRVIGLLNEVMEHLSAAVEAEGGVVDKYVGDELMALFGAPMAQHDNAARAVRTALRMQADIAEYNRARVAHGEPAIGIGIGINTGSVVAGNMGSQRRLNYTVVGESVNLAARLCSAAEPGQILISETTLERAAGACEAAPLGDRALKGFSSAVAIYEVDTRHPAAAGR